jgi:hypothetical protein
MNRGLLSCLLLAVVVALGVFAEVTFMQFPRSLRIGLWPVRQQAGDDHRWADPAWDDSTWKSGTTVQAGTGPLWLRFRFKLPEQRGAWAAGGAVTATAPLPVEPPLDGLYLAAVYPFELYWDGKYIGGSGKVGRSRETEGAGPLDNLIALPPHLTTPGEHVVAMRVSTYRYNFPADSFEILPSLVNLAEFRYREGRRPLFPLVGATAAFLTALISLVLLGVVERSRSLLLCCLLSAVLAAFYGLVAFRWLYNAPFDWFYPRLLTITVLMTAVAVLFPLLLLDAFAVPRKRLVLLVLAPLIVLAWMLSPIYEWKVHGLCRGMLVVSLGIAAWAAWRRKTGALGVAIGVLVSLFLVQTNRRDFLSPQFLGTFSVLVIYVFGTVSLQGRETWRRMMEATVTTARLESELLKKSLQPHFLLNSLTVLSEVVERDPPAAMRLIDDLGHTFRALSHMTGEKQVTLGQELELCRAHLRVLSARTGRPGSLTVEQADDVLKVPPAVFLTLVENGLTHQAPPPGGREFRLSWSKSGATERFRFHSPGAVRERPDGVAGGTGLRYVRARLEECFPGQWRLQHGPVPGGWQTDIELRRKE